MTTYGKAVNDIRDSIIEFESTNAIESELLNRVNESVNDIQIRDFLMGITLENYTNNTLIAYIQYLIENKPSASLYAVLSSYVYRIGDSKLALKLLDKCSELEPSYSLMMLLRRVIASGWPVSALESMVYELHPKVTAGLMANSEVSIGEFATV